MAVPQKMFIRSSQVTNHGSMRMSPKQNNGPRRQAISNESYFWQKHFEANGRLLHRQKWACSDCSSWATLHGQFWVVHHNFFGEIRKTNKKRRIIVHNDNAIAYRLKSAPFWPAKTPNWWINRRTALTWHPMTSFSFCTSRKYCVVNDFRQTPIFVKLVFQVTVNNTNNGYTSKRSEYNYA